MGFPGHCMYCISGNFRNDLIFTFFCDHFYIANIYEYAKIIFCVIFYGNFFVLQKLLTQIKNDTLVHFLDFLKFYDTQEKTLIYSILCRYR